MAVERYVHPRDEDKYLSLFADADGQKCLGEASTRYLRSQVAPALIREFQPEARIVIMLRDPISLLHALHNERVANSSEDIVDFAEALAADTDRREGRRLPPGGTAAASVYRDVVRFGSDLRRWLGVFGAERVHVVLLDDLVARPPETFAKLLEFLEVDATYRPDSFEARNTSHRRGLAGRMIRRSGLAALLRGGLSRVIGANASHRLAGRAKRSRVFLRPSARSPIPTDLRTQLQAELASEVDLLGQLLDRDVRSLWWAKATST